MKQKSKSHKTGKPNHIEEVQKEIEEIDFQTQNVAAVNVNIFNSNQKSWYLD